jgi:uncharacterized membrane protein
MGETAVTPPQQRASVLTWSASSVPPRIKGTIRVARIDWHISALARDHMTNRNRTPHDEPAAHQEAATPKAVIENIQRISELEAAARRELTGSERIGKRITDFVGTLRFVVLHVVLFATWAIWNLYVPEHLQFDPYPFGLMTMLLSLESVSLVAFVLITQNRMMLHTERRDHLGLQVSMLTEQELTMVLRLLGRLCEHAGIPAESDHQRRVEDLMQETDVHHVVEKLDEELRKE